MMTQSNDRTLVIALPEWWEGQLDEAMFDDFEAQHNGVEVVPKFVTQDDINLSHPYINFDTHINKSLEYASMGDVLMTNSYLMSAEATRAGIYLDLAPLTVTDTNLESDDFYPALWQSFQWDGGVWGVPVVGSLVMNVYEQTKFDEVNYPYPNPSWTLADYSNAARTLAHYTISGSAELPGLHTYQSSALFYSLLNKNLYDGQSINLLDDDVINLLREWTQLQADNVANPLTLEFDLADAPLNVEETFRLSSQYYQQNGEWRAALLPNAQAGLRVEGFAVSAGTDYPELAYELAMYLSSYPDITRFFSFDVPARISMETIANREQQTVLGERTDEQIQLIYDGLSNAIPYSEVRYYGYLSLAIQLVNGQGLSVEDALIEAQQVANENLVKADEIGKTTQVFVESPAVTPLLSGEIKLNFALNTVVSPAPNRAEWERIAQEFIASDSEVGNIQIHYGFNGIPQVAEQNDCFYRQLNDMQPAYLQYILPIEPYLNADTSFNRDDIVTGGLVQATYNDQIYGMPMNVTPSILWVNETLFNEAGIPLPDNTWTVNEFANALVQLSTVSDNPPFVSDSFGGTYIINLITAYGGLLYSPNNINTPDLQSEQNINAIRQVLDLARNGQIDYDALGNFNSRSGFDPDTTPIYSATLSALDYRFQQRRDGSDDIYRAVLFPQGSQYNPITLDVGISYISANTPYAEACYRWLSHLAQTPELFDGMPARSTQLESTQTQGEDIYTLYQSINTILDDPNTIVYPLSSTDPTTFFYHTWMFRAFDAYVLEDVSLENALTNAQETINAYTACIEPIDRSAFASVAELNAEYEKCATQVDAVFAEMFGG